VTNPVTTATVSSPSHTHAQRVAGWATIGVGAGALVLGATFVGLASATNDDITHPSPGAVWSSSVQDRLHLYEHLDTAFFVVGGVAIVAGTIVEILGHRMPHTPSIARFAPSTTPVQIAF
jgi:hypothetical protein